MKPQRRVFVTVHESERKPIVAHVKITDVSQPPRKIYVTVKDVSQPPIAVKGTVTKLENKPISVRVNVEDAPETPIPSHFHSSVRPCLAEQLQQHESDYANDEE